MDIYGTLTFPKITYVQLESFSLYNLKPSITLDIPSGVFCLAGANGLGKSTFLASINFALTGIVADPSKEFRSVIEYYSDNADYSNDFFTGRILEKDRNNAAISIQMDIGSMQYFFTRGVFEPNQLRELTIYDKNTSSVILDTSNLIPKERHIQYASNVTSHIGLKAFDQFVFLQHMVLTFDESRRLLFWDKAALNQAIYLCIGAEPEKAEEADKLKREIERADSLARNASWQASTIRKEIDLIRKGNANNFSMEQLEQVQQRHELLLEMIKERQGNVDNKRRELSDVELKWTVLSAELTSLQSQYSNEFSRLFDTKSSTNLGLHPIIATLISDKQCPICQTQGQSVVETVLAKVNNQICPLCESMI